MLRLKDQAPHASARRFCGLTLKFRAACVKATSRSSTAHPQEMLVMPGLVLGIRVLNSLAATKAWMAGSSPAMAENMRSRADQCPLWVFFIASSCSGVAAP
jgi:hypothetical protein